MRVAVFGAGYAGLTVARQLERRLSEEVDLVVVDESTDHLVQHELHRVIRHPSLTDAITVSLENVLSWADIEQARVTDIDTTAGVATLDGKRTLEYDVAAVCLGSQTAFYGMDDVKDEAIPLKSLGDARAIREQALDAPGGEAIVGGAGLSGIQVAGELVALSETESLDLDVRLVEMADQVAPGFDDTFADVVRTELESRGVAVETGCRIETATDGTVTLEDGRSLATDLFVWTGGIRGPDSLDGRRQETSTNLRVSDRTFVVGDAADVAGDDGEAVPASAQTAVRQGRVAAENIERILQDVTADSEHGEDDSQDEDTGLTAYNHQTAGWVVSIGEGAVARVGPLVFSGEPARAAKAVIGFGHLGSVGAIRQAEELVAEELGWPTAHGLGVDGPEGKPSSELPTDPASLGQYSGPITTLLTVFGETLPTDGPVDLTGVTRQLDTSSPDSLFTAVTEAVVEPMQTVWQTDSESSGDEESVTIEVETVDNSDTSAGEEKGDTPHDQQDESDSGPGSKGGDDEEE